jgi:hypothetical protein
MKLTIGAITVALALTLAPSAMPQQPSKPVVVRVESGGFHWVDALIGAAAVAGIALGLSGTFSLYLRRDRTVGPATTKEEE